MKRRSFIAGLGSASVWPVVVRAQQAAIPVIGIVGLGAVNAVREFEASFRLGLSDLDYFEGRNVVIEYHWSQFRSDQLAETVADLVRRQVAVIVAVTTPAALASKEATKSIPIVFSIAADPIEVGLAASLAHPGGNCTGISNLTVSVAAKRLELLPKTCRDRRRLRCW